MSLLGVRLTLLVGPTVAVPAPMLLTEALQSLEIRHTSAGRSGFQMTFQAGRGGSGGGLDYPLLSGPWLRSFNRVVAVVTFNAIPHVLLDGVITHQQLAPGDGPGAATVTVTGEDLSVMLDLQERIDEHVAQDETMIATKIILRYAEYGLIPLVIPPPSVNIPLPIERVPVQRDTDLGHLEAMAARFGYVFSITPGPMPLTSIAYWGPPKRVGLPQPALSVNMGPGTNVASLSFQHNALAPTRVAGDVLDRTTGQTLPLRTFASARPPLASRPALLAQSHVRTAVPKDTSGLSYFEALDRAQAVTEESSDDVVTASGELDTLTYGNVLQAGGLVGVRGAGYGYDGSYYVKSVTHSISRGSYKQRVTLVREGTGALLPVVRP